MKVNFDPERKIKIKVGESGKVEFRLRDVMVVPDAKISLKKDMTPLLTSVRGSPGASWDTACARLPRTNIPLQRILRLRFRKELRRLAAWIGTTSATCSPSPAPPD